MKNPWKTLNTKEIYTNPWIRVREDQVITPQGNPGIYGVVETKPAVGIIPLTENLDTYLVGQYRYTLDCYSWEIPEGGVEKHESLLAGAKRELLEETGLSAKKWTNLGEIYTSNCFTNERGELFIAEGLTENAAQPDPTEELKLIKIPFLEAWKMVLEQEIKDALAVIGLMRTFHYLKEKNKL